MAMPILIPKRFFTCAVTQNSTEYVGAQNKCLNLVGHLLEIVALLRLSITPTLKMCSKFVLSKLYFCLYTEMDRKVACDGSLI